MVLNRVTGGPFRMQGEIQRCKIGSSPKLWHHQNGWSYSTHVLDRKGGYVDKVALPYKIESHVVGDARSAKERHRQANSDDQAMPLCCMEPALANAMVRYTKWSEIGSSTRSI